MRFPLWGDLLTAYNGTAITYDEVGNPNGYNDRTFTWEHGRQLASQTKGGVEWEYTYDANGMRTSRSSDSKSYEYVYSGDKLVQMTVTDTTANTTQLLEFTYDAAGQPLTMTLDGVIYYYLLNIQGDVMGLVDGSGNLLAAFSYTAYGKAYSINNVSSMGTTLASANPLTYRGYVLDMGTGIYYLQSRYYDPQLGRFLNADGLTSTGQGTLGNNVFAYCLNNPVMMCDKTGTIAVSTIILIASIVVGVACAGYTAYKETKAKCEVEQIVGDTICAGISGFCIVYTCGYTAYQCYQNYCYLNAITPVTDIGTSANVSSQIQNCANTANTRVEGTGSVAGTSKHTVFAKEINALNNPNLVTEVSYKDGQVVPYGTSGSIRFDVMQYNQNGVPIAAWDFKTGSAMLTDSRISQMLGKSGLSIPIYEVR